MVVPSEAAYSAEAEEVRAFLVQVRGGSPFLSSPDGRALHAWLAAGVPVTTLLRGIEAAAARRRAIRSRKPFTLVGCRKAIEGLRSGLAKAEDPVAIQTSEAAADATLADEAARVEAATAAMALVQLEDPEARARARCAIARVFHQQLWDDLAPQRESLLATAAAALSDLAEALEPRLYANLCEEWARDRLRQRYPQFTPTRIWEECSLGVE
jgi:hypothetical protein